MINHEYKCIFIHIPRCAGTSMEVSIHGDSYKMENFRYKHLTSSYAKILYKDYWDDYFKFSFVRNPWDRMVSMSKFPSFYGCKINDKGLLNIQNYLKKFPVIEIDERTDCKKKYNKKIIKNSVYKNILIEDIDFIGRFENLKDDWSFVCDKLNGVPPDLGMHQPTKLRAKKHYSKYYNQATLKLVEKIYQKDIEYFDYKFEKKDV